MSEVLTATDQVLEDASDYILVALDASPHSAAALISAAELAAALHVELRGLFVEDIDLLRLAMLPFTLEFGSFTARPRRLMQTDLEREFRVQAGLLRKAMADVAGQRRVNWSFQVVRGGVTREVLTASATARMVSLGRVGRTPGKRTGSTAQAVARNTNRPVLIQSARQKLSGPFTVVHLGSLASENALRLAAQLAVGMETRLEVWVLGLAPAAVGEIAARAAELHKDSRTQAAPGEGELLAHLRQLRTGAVLLPVEVAPWLDEITATVVVVP
jgi:nucleotide-binding universal stress UspA family protein